MTYNNCIKIAREKRWLEPRKLRAAIYANRYAL